jgi:WD40 repeat protein/serine/threonine protein kinase
VDRAVAIDTADFVAEANWIAAGRAPRRVLLRALPDDLRVPDPVREALRRLDHPNVARILDVVDVGERQLLVAEQLTGNDLWSLRDRLLATPVPEWFYLSVAEQALAGLCYLEERVTAGPPPALGLRDLLLCADGTVVILGPVVARVDPARLERPEPLSRLAPPLLGLALLEGLERSATRDTGAAALAGPPRVTPGDLAATLARRLRGTCTAATPSERQPTPAMLAAVRQALQQCPTPDGAGVARFVATLCGTAPPDGSATRLISRGARPASTPSPSPGSPGGGATLDPIVGRTLGDFVVRERLAEGGFGVVYRAEQPFLAREAVIKVMSTQLRAKVAFVQRFMQEARLASSLDHPYAAHIYAFGAEPDGLLWIAMELVHGLQLSRFLRERGPLRLSEWVPLLRRICEVVQSAHDQGIVHRDLKPENVMVLSRSGRLLPKLLDFGIARLSREAASPSGSSDEAASPPAHAGPAAPPASPGPTLASADFDAAASPAWSSAGRSTPRPGHDEDSLTPSGSLVGSPPYAAPEQWVDPAAADARTDQYALGVLTFKALTGHTPFRGDEHELAYAHARLPVPQLGAAFPPPVDAVVQRAMAKQRDDRYPSVLEFAAALSSAAGLDVRQPQVPQLEETLRDLIGGGGPRPLAEAVMVLEAARNVHQARGAIFDVAHVVTRLLATIALAARARLGAWIGEPPEVAERLAALRLRELNDHEWLQLAQGLCQPFGRRPEAHPVPELVRFFAAVAPDEPAAAHLELLLEARQRVESGASASEAEVAAQLNVLLEHLTSTLRGVTFLDDYPLVVPTGEAAALWVGPRRAVPLTMLIGGGSLTSGQPALVSRDGLAVVTLWPLAQVGAPAPGAPEELFLFAGRGRHGAKLASTPNGFERHDPELWDWFRAHLLDVGDEAAPDAVDQEAPFRGLTTFRAQDAALFFGREHETEAFANRLRVQPLIAVVGPSGAGKSSFVQAGVIPTLSNDWRAIVVRPGRTPFATLAAALVHHKDQAEALASRLRDSPAALGEQLRSTAWSLGQSILLVVDQFEELFTLCGDPDERACYAAALAAAGSPQDPLRVVLTLRDDFLIRAHQLPALQARLAQGLQLLGTPSPQDLLRILVEPARRRGYGFEPPQLAEEMIRAVADQPSALALLSFTALKLWERRDERARQLTRTAYEALGGVGGALAQHAETTLLAMLPEEQSLVREVFRQLVTAAGTRAVLTRPELLQVLGGSVRAETMLEKLITARLLVAQESSDGEDRVEVVHEALISAWPRLVSWQREDAESARLRDQLRAAAKQWDDRHRARGLLWRDEALTEYRLWRRHYPGRLTDVEESFAATSLAAAAAGQRRRHLIVATALAVLTVGVVALYIMNVRATRANVRATAAAAEARSRLAQSYYEQGRQALLDGRHLDALAYLREVRDMGRDSAPLRMMLAVAARSLEPQRLQLGGHQGRALRVALARDGSRIVSTDEQGANLFEARSGRRVARLQTGARTWSAAFSPDGTLVGTAGTDNLARLWSASDGRLVATLRGHGAEIRVMVFSSDGTSALTGADDKTARLWDVRAAKERRVLRGHTAGVYDAALSPDGRTVGTASDDKTARLWDAATGATRAVLRHGETVLSVRFDPEGRRVATSSWDGTARIWSVTDGRLLHTINAHGDKVELADFSPDGRLLVTAGVDGTARVWDAATAAQIAVMRGHRGAITFAEFDRTCTRVVTSGLDGTVRLWNARSGRLQATLEGHAATARQVRFSPDGRTAVSVGMDGTVRAWDVAEPYLRAEWPRTSGSLGVELVPRSMWMVAAAASSLRVWDLAGPTLTATLAAPKSMDAFAVGRRGEIVLAATGREVRWWGRDDIAPRTFSTTAEVTTLAPCVGRACVVVAEKGARLGVWDTERGTRLTELKGHRQDVKTIEFDPAGSRFATLDEDGEVNVWTHGAARPLATFTVTRGVDRWLCRFSPDGRRLAVVVGRHGALFDLDRRQRLASLEGHLQTIWDMKFDHSGTRLVTASGDNTARVWDGVSGALQRHLTGSPQFLFTADFDETGSILVTTGGDGDLRLWDVETAKPFYVIDAHGEQGSLVEFLRGSASGARLVSIGTDGETFSWSLPVSPPDQLDSLLRCRLRAALDRSTGLLVPRTAPPDCETRAP